MLKRVLVVLGVLGVMVVLMIGGLANTKPQPVPPASSTGSQAPSRAPDLPVPTIRDGETPYGLAGDSSPLGEGGQSELWFNDGAWWGVLLNAGSQTFRIHRLDWENLTWIDTRTVVQTRSFARSDVLWNGNHLYVASAGAKARTSNGVELSRFSYDQSAGAYTQDANFPVVLTESGVRSLSLAQDSTGELWISYIDNDSLFVRHSLESDLVWTPPLTPAALGVGGQVDAAAITNAGSATAIVWTEAATDLVHIGVHLDTRPEGAWKVTLVTVDGLTLGPDELALSAMQVDDTPRIYAALRTSISASPQQDRMAPQIVLIEAEVGGTTAVHLVSRVDDAQTTPIVLLNGMRRTVSVASTSRSTDGGQVFYTQSALDAIAFPSGPGLPVLQGDGTTSIVGLSSSKEPLSAQAGIVLLTADTVRGTYRYVALDFGEGSTTPPLPSPGQRPQALSEETFDGLRLGDRPSRWEVLGGASDAWSVTSLSGIDRVARLSAINSGVVTACLGFPPVGSGLLHASGELRLNAVPSSEPRLLSIRGAGGEVVSVRLLHGSFSYFDGGTRIKSGVALTARSWYRVELSLHLSSRTYDLRVTEAGSETPLIQSAGLAWRPSQATELDRVCLENEGEPGADLFIDNLLVATDSQP